MRGTSETQLPWASTTKALTSPAEGVSGSLTHPLKTSGPQMSTGRVPRAPSGLSATSLGLSLPLPWSRKSP